MFASREPLGRLIRWPLALIPRDTAVPILTGPNKGLRWVVGSGTHGCWIGSYERENAEFVAGLCRPGMIAFDIGAHAGYFTLLLARRCREVIAFEPQRGNMSALRNHLSLNGLRNVTTSETAVAQRPGSLRLSGAGFQAKLSDRGIATTAVRLDDYPTPDLVKMDIEGGEVEALKGAVRILSERRTLWFIETHGTKSSCHQILKANGYAVERIGVGHTFAKPS